VLGGLGFAVVVAAGHGRSLSPHGDATQVRAALQHVLGGGVSTQRSCCYPSPRWCLFEHHRIGGQQW
jgi:hypothetical protein